MPPAPGGRDGRLAVRRARYILFPFLWIVCNLHNISNLAIMPSNRNLYRSWYLSPSHSPTRTDAGHLPHTHTHKCYKRPPRPRSLPPAPVLLVALVASTGFVLTCPILINTTSSPPRTGSTIIITPRIIRPTFTRTVKVRDPPAL